MEIKECLSFSQWILNAKPNDKYIYFKGFSLMDTFVGIELQGLSYKMACIGSVYLVQQKIGPSEYNFIAVRASTPPFYKLVPTQTEPRSPTVSKPSIQKRVLGVKEHLEISGLN